MIEFNKARRSFLIGSGSSLLLTLLPIPAFAEVPKAICSKAGQKVLLKGKNYICVKKSGKLQWQLLTPAKPTITLHPTPSTIQRVLTQQRLHQKQRTRLHLRQVLPQHLK